VRKNRDGTVLLEVMVAMALIALTSLAVVGSLGEAARVLAEYRDREHALDRASRTIALYTLMTGPELDQRLGSRPVRGLLVSVQRPEPALYRIAVSDSLAPSRELLATVVFRKAT
jgi:hypothetical protein